MAGEDKLGEFRREAGRKARITEEMAKGRNALRSLHFRQAASHAKQALGVDSTSKPARWLLLRSRVAMVIGPLFLVLAIGGLGWLGFMFATTWGPPLWTQEPPPVLPTRTPMPTRTPRPPTPTRTSAPTAAPRPSATPTAVDLRVEILQTRVTGRNASIEVKVYEDGENRYGLQKEDFTLGYPGHNLPFAFQERDADDPVCIVVAVDNSGSIIPGLQEIRAAVRSLNDLRKPGDELGLILFAEPDKVEVEQPPSEDALNDTVVTGEGDRTALWDGVLLGLQQAQECTVETRYVLVLTDGADTGSVMLTGDDTDRAIAVAAQAEEQNVGICTVGVESEALKEEPLTLAAYGCRYQRASRFDDLVSLFQDLFGSVRHFYRIEFDVGELAPDQNSLTLRVLDAVDATVNFSR